MRLFLELGLTIDELQKLLKRRVEVLDFKPSTIRKKCEFLVEYTAMTNAQFRKVRFWKGFNQSLLFQVFPQVSTDPGIQYEENRFTSIRVFAVHRLST